MPDPIEVKIVPAAPPVSSVVQSEIPQHKFHGFTELPVGYLERAAEAGRARAAITELVETIDPNAGPAAAVIDIIKPDLSDAAAQAANDAKADDLKQKARK